MANQKNKETKNVSKTEEVADKKTLVSAPELPQNSKSKAEIFLGLLHVKYEGKEIPHKAFVTLGQILFEEEKALQTLQGINELIKQEAKSQ